MTAGVAVCIPVVVIDVYAFPGGKPAGTFLPVLVRIGVDPVAEAVLRRCAGEGCQSSFYFVYIEIRLTVGAIIVCRNARFQLGTGMHFLLGRNQIAVVMVTPYGVQRRIGLKDDVFLSGRILRGGGIFIRRPSEKFAAIAVGRSGGGNRKRLLTNT